MPETSTPSTDLNRAARDAKKQAGEVSDAAQDLYNQAVDSASHTAGAGDPPTAARINRNAMTTERPHRNAPVQATYPKR